MAAHMRRTDSLWQCPVIGLKQTWCAGTDYRRCWTHFGTLVKRRWV